MLKKISERMQIVGIILLGLGVFLANPSPILAQKQTHVVQRGDTLWDLCEKYYGDAELWPKLWEMNPFVTNPHLLEPGDVITLLEGVPTREGARAEGKTGEGAREEGKTGEAAREEGKTGEGAGPKKRVPSERDKRAAKKGGPLPESMGIDIASFINVKNLGFLSPRKIRPWGQIVGSDSHKSLLETKDSVFVVFDGNKKVRPGDEFTIANSSPVLKHPLTDSTLGYVISFHGRLVVEGQAGVGIMGGRYYPSPKNAYVAKITDIYEPVSVGNMLIPYEPDTSCIRPVPVDGRFIDNIVAARDDTTVLSEMSIVYLNRGSKQGIRKGNLFEIIKTNVVPEMNRESYTVDELYDQTTIAFPDSRIGTLLVLDARPETSTALILSATDIFTLGTYIKGGFTPLERTESLSSLPTCPAD